MVLHPFHKEIFQASLGEHVFGGAEVNKAASRIMATLLHNFSATSKTWVENFKIVVSLFSAMRLKCSRIFLVAKDPG